MNTKWLATMKPSFQTEWLVLPSKESHQVLEKITLLTENPHPDGKVKKQLVHIDPKLHRIRSGDYRIFYTFDKQYVSLLALRRRKEDTYDDDYEVEFLGGLDAEVDVNFDAIHTAPLPAIPALPIIQKKPLPEPITKELLVNLHVPEEYQAKLLAIQTEDDLLSSLEIPALYIEQILECMFPRTYKQIIQQPDYVVQEVDDLLRFKEGKLLGFLLKLSPEQETATNWAMHGAGPTQVKGNPGTGKSTVALYRIRAILQDLNKQSQCTPRILYTTYTNALMKSSDQLLRQLLGNDIQHVAVKTADLVVYDVLEHAGQKNWKAANGSTLTGTIKWALKQLVQEKNDHYQKALATLSEEYLLEEFSQVIIARKVETLQEYLVADRRGRRYKLTSMQREAVWRVYELFLQLLKRTRRETWEQVRLRAEDIYERTSNIPKYDAVVVDEAQDLDPSLLRLLVNLCKSINRFFVTADANQSIYRGSFSWTDVHESLNFQGRRTIILRTNYRSTRQISEAAQSYLANGALETDTINSVHMYIGPLPCVCYVQSDDDEFNVLVSFLPDSAREARLTLGSCAVLCPTKEIGYGIASALIERGLPARFMRRQEIDLEYTGVKILTLHSSKGLEFPVVALAGFSNSRFVKAYEEILDEEQQEERLGRDRRILFVGMTRAMRTLLVIAPAGSRSPLLTGFDPNYWKIQKL